MIELLQMQNWIIQQQFNKKKIIDFSDLLSANTWLSFFFFFF